MTQASLPMETAEQNPNITTDGFEINNKFGHAVKNYFKKAFIFTGRASRGEFWWIWLLGLILVLVHIWLFLFKNYTKTPQRFTVASITALILFFPMISLSVRRARDSVAPTWLIIIPLALSLTATISARQGMAEKLEQVQAYYGSHTAPGFEFYWVQSALFEILQSVFYGGVAEMGKIYLYPSHVARKAISFEPLLFAFATALMLILMLLPTKGRKKKEKISYPAYITNAAVVGGVPVNAALYAQTQNMNDAAWYGIGFGDAFKRAFQKYATFSGRASRGEFWYFYLATVLICIIPIVGAIYLLIVAIPYLALIFRRLHDTGRSGWTWGIPMIISNLIAIAGTIAIIIIATTLHGSDAELGLIITIATVTITTLILTIYVLVMLARPSQPTTNKYGPGPDEVAQYVANITQNNPLATPITQIPATTLTQPQTPPLPSSTPTTTNTPDPILAELANPATPATRLQEIANLSINHPEYRATLLFHPNTYPELTDWIRGLP